MAVTKRNRRVGELFLQAAGVTARIRRELTLSNRMSAAETLVRLHGGIGRHSRDRLKRILKEIVATAKVKLNGEKIDQTEFQNLLDRVEVVGLRLANMPENRKAHQELEEEENKKLLAEAKPPFPTPPGYKWMYGARSGQVVWALVSPVKFKVIVRKEANAI